MCVWFTVWGLLASMFFMSTYDPTNKSAVHYPLFNNLLKETKVCSSIPYQKFLLMIDASLFTNY